MAKDGQGQNRDTGDPLVRRRVRNMRQIDRCIQEWNGMKHTVHYWNMFKHWLTHYEMHRKRTCAAIPVIGYFLSLKALGVRSYLHVDGLHVHHCMVETLLNRHPQALYLWCILFSCCGDRFFFLHKSKLLPKSIWQCLVFLPKMRPLPPVRFTTHRWCSSNSERSI